MTASPRPDSFEVIDYLRVLRRRGWIAFALACLGVLAAAAYLTVAPKSYTASASVAVTPNAANTGQVAGSRTAGQAVNMDNEAQIVQSNTVAALAKKALHSDASAQHLASQVKVTVPPNTLILVISCTARSAVGAAQCAQQFGVAYLSTRENDARSKVASQLSQLQSLATPLQNKQLSLRRKLKTLPPSSPKVASDNAQLKDVTSKLNALTGRIATLGASVSYPAGTVITAAVPPTAPSSPKPLLYLPSGLLAGLLLGLVAAFALDRRDNRIHAARDIERFFDLPVLFSLPQQRFGPQSTLISPRSRTGRAFTELAQAAAAALGEGDHVILVAGTSPGQSTSVVAANLAATLARTRSEVILVCADLRDAVTPALLGVGDGRGLAELLAGTATVSEVVRRPAEISRLRVITPGMDTAAAFNQLQHDASRRLVAELQRDARYVVIEAQATGEGADTFSLAEFADAAIVVAEISTTTRAELEDSLRRLDRMRTAVLGAAVLPVSRRGSKPAARKEKAKPDPRPPAPARQRQRPSQDPDAARPATADLRPRAAAADPHSRPLPGQQRIATAAARGTGETWPLPRVPSAAPDKNGPRPPAGQPSDKPAEGS